MRLVWYLPPNISVLMNVRWCLGVKKDFEIYVRPNERATTSLVILFTIFIRCHLFSPAITLVSVNLSCFCAKLYMSYIQTVCGIPFRTRFLLAVEQLHNIIHLLVFSHLQPTKLRHNKKSNQEKVMHANYIGLWR